MLGRRARGLVQAAARGAASRGLPQPQPRAEAAGGALLQGSRTRLDAAGAPFHSQAPAEQASAAAASAAAEPTLIPFPREGPGVSYALNWALAEAGVTPAGTVSRPGRPAGLAELAKGTAVKPSSGSKLLIQGSVGDTALTPQLLRRTLKEVTSFLSGLPTLVVHDGAVGSSSSSDARTRVIAETAGAAAAVAKVLEPTPSRTVAASSFPITVYAAPSYKSDALGLGFVATDLSSGLIVAAGSAVGDAAALKSVLAAAAAGPILKQGALSLPGRLVAGSGSGPFILLSPSAAGDSLLAKSSAWPDLGVVWGARGVARLFPTAAAAETPNLYLPPSAIVLLTTDSTGALPPSTKLTPDQAAFYFLVGYDGANFNPALARSPFALGSADPLALAQTFASLLSSSNIPAYLVNAHGEPDVRKLVTSVAAGKAGASKRTSDGAVTDLKTKLEEFAKGRFPNIPEAFAP